MNQKELVKKLDTVIHNLNEDGLSLMYGLMGDIHKIEKYNINTAPERVAQIKLQESEAAALEAAAKKEKQHAECMKRMAEEIKARNEAIASLTGKERALWNKIEKVKKMNIHHYVMSSWQTELIAKIYKNNYLNASYETFCYGFHQGMQYMKNQSKKRKSFGESHSSFGSDRGCIA